MMNFLTMLVRQKKAEIASGRGASLAMNGALSHNSWGLSSVISREKIFCYECPWNTMDQHLPKHFLFLRLDTVWRMHSYLFYYVLHALLHLFTSLIKILFLFAFLVSNDIIEDNSFSYFYGLTILFLFLFFFLSFSLSLFDSINTCLKLKIVIFWTSDQKNPHIKSLNSLKRRNFKVHSFIFFLLLPQSYLLSILPYRILLSVFSCLS